MNALKKIFSNPIAYVFIYIILMIPTYILPYLGSNSYVMQSVNTAIMAGQESSGIKPLFYIHLIIMFAMILIVWIRGSEINKKWLVIFPVLAMAFDLLPAINNIPMVPTIMHLLAIILGVVGFKKA